MKRNFLMLILTFGLAISFSSAFSCSGKKNNSKKESDDDDLEKEFAKSQLNKKKPVVKTANTPKSNGSSNNNSYMSRTEVQKKLATIGINVKVINCNINSIHSEVIPDENMKVRQHFIRLYSHQYKEDYVAKAHEYNYISSFIESSKTWKASFYMKEGIAWHKAGNIQKAKDAFYRMMNEGPEYVEGLARYAIFLATVRKPHTNLREASNYASKAGQYASSKKDLKYVADALAEIALARGRGHEACMYITPHYTVSSAEYKCKEYKKGRSRYRKPSKKPPIPRAVKYIWRKVGKIPTGALTCEENIFLYYRQAEKLAKLKQYDEAIKIYQKGLRWQMSTAQLSEMLADYADLLLRAKKNDSALKAVALAAEIEPTDYHYGKIMYGYVMTKVDKTKYKQKIIKFTKKGLAACSFSVSNCLYQAALNYARVGEPTLALPLLKKGKDTFYTDAFYSGYRKLKRGKKWPRR
jgi:tetratricopeptide (TPR) repeat protein